MCNNCYLIQDLNNINKNSFIKKIEIIIIIKFIIIPSSKMSSIINFISYYIYSTNQTDKNNYKDFEKVLEYVPSINFTSKIKEHNYDLNEELITCIREFCEKQNTDKFIISLSGGVDSMVLISIIHYLGYIVIGVHINYNNRSETKEEEEFLDFWCNFNSITLYKKSINEIKRSNSKN